KVACWNAARGCSFVGPTAGLLDHYKECDLGTVFCCQCCSPMLQSDILEHFKEGCCTHQATGESADDHATQDLEDACRTGLETKEATENASEDLVPQQASLNQCSKDIRVEGARCQGQLEAEASTFTEQPNELGTACTTAFAKELQVLQATMADYKEHLSKELGLQREKLAVVLDIVSQSLLSHHRPEKVHWYIEQWADLKMEALAVGFQWLDSPTRCMYNYCISQRVLLTRTENGMRLGYFLRIHPGDHDSQLEWPFGKAYTLGVIHPKDRRNVISVKINAAENQNLPHFQRPSGQRNLGFGAYNLVTVKELEMDGFVQDNILHMFLEVEP
ncbi:unnamed protein product, partial [Ixodes hexagonus]